MKVCRTKARLLKPNRSHPTEVDPVPLRDSILESYCARHLVLDANKAALTFAPIISPRR